jgi:hypothetical protein
MIELGGYPISAGAEERTAAHFLPRDVGGKKPVRLVIVGFVLLCVAGGACADESATDVICKALLDSARRGDMVELRRMIPGLEKCQEISEAKLSRQLQDQGQSTRQGKAK